jgi:nucleotide-binding universal stress UspA family protein
MTSIVVATDGSLSAERAVHVSADIAKSRRADVVLVTIIDEKPIPDEIVALAEVEHMADHAPQAHAAHRANIPFWMMEGAHAAARAEESIAIRRSIADLALQKARSILVEAGVETINETVMEGDPTKLILAAAEDANAEMIVLGTRGLGTLETLVHGSTSTEVAKQANCTTVTVT